MYGHLQRWIRKNVIGNDNESDEDGGTDCAVREKEIQPSLRHMPSSEDES